MKRAIHAQHVKSFSMPGMKKLFFTPVATKKLLCLTCRVFFMPDMRNAVKNMNRMFIFFVNETKRQTGWCFVERVVKIWNQIIIERSIICSYVLAAL